MNGRALLIALLSTVLVGAEAEAQDYASLVPAARDRAARIPEGRTLSAEDRSRSTLVSYASCLLNHNRVRAEKVAWIRDDDAVYSAQARELSSEECLSSGELKFQVSLLRGGIFAAMYRRDFSKSAPPLNEKPLNFHEGLDEHSDHDAQVRAELLTFADCVVRKDPAASRAFILGPVASSSEQAALNQLVPQLGGCMPQGAKVRFNKVTLYGFIAEAAYRESSSDHAVTAENKVRS